MEGTYSPTSGTNPDIYACPPPYFLRPLFLFLSDTAELFLEPIPSDKFSTRPSTRGGEGGACEGLGPNHYCFLCQVSTNRGLSHPFLTPHPWLPERYFAGFTMKPVSSPPALKHGPGRHDKNHSANGNYAGAYSKKCDPSEMSWQVLSLPRTVSVYSRLPLNPEADEPAPGTWGDHRGIFRVMPKHGCKVPFRCPAARCVLALSLMSYADWNQTSCLISSSWNFITFKTIAKRFPTPQPCWELNKTISTRFFGFYQSIKR